MSCTTVPESQSSLESPECGRSAAEATSQTSINERKRVSALYKEQEYNFIPKYSEIYEIGSETFVDDVTVAAEKMAQKIYDYYYM